MRVRSVLGVWLGALLVGGLLAGGAGVASAAPVYGNFMTFGPTLNYQGRSFIDPVTKKAGANTRNKALANVPIGYLGVQGILYTQSGTLCRTGTWQYNSTAVYSMNGGLTSGYCGGGPYQAWSASRGWDPATSSYYTNYDDPTVAQNF